MTNRKLPKGIWYEKSRGRYRVRVYSANKVYHLSYHRSLNEAKHTLRKVLDLKQEAEYQCCSIDSTTTQNLLKSLQAVFQPKPNNALVRETA